jgi:hypothetical protein
VFCRFDLFTSETSSGGSADFTYAEDGRVQGRPLVPQIYAQIGSAFCLVTEELGYLFHLSCHQLYFFKVSQGVPVPETLVAKHLNICWL